MPEMKKMKSLPIGVDLFEKVIEKDFYYVDKTRLIKAILDDMSEVNLFTRPRRFGKTLNMSMLKSFFEIGTDPSMFDGLVISREREICEEYQGKYPVVFLSLKGVGGLDYGHAFCVLREVVSNECQRLAYLAESSCVSDKDRARFIKLLNAETDEAGLQFAISTLMRMLHAHFGKKVILLIDEYDVPLDKANDNEYYPEMVNFLRGFFGEAFKTNPDLCFAVVTGCLRISKESIFTGINNLKVDTIADEHFDEFFGFTDAEVKQMLADYGVPDAYGSTKEWYDGYRFGNTDVYCPWDVINHCDRLRKNPAAEPKAYWNNTSSNQIVRRFVDFADATTRKDIERLIAGESICKEIVEDLTYGELEDDREHLWSVLYLTGYLTLEKRDSDAEDGKVFLVIPNREIREIFIEKIRKWFAEKIACSGRNEIYREIWDGDADALQERIRNILLDTISYHDYHENYYHALLAGLLLDENYVVRSNYEMGRGRSDIVIEDDKNRRVVMIETKRSADYDTLEADAEKALTQIREKQYAAPYLKRKYRVLAYGISFAGKDCFVMCRQIKIR